MNNNVNYVRFLNDINFIIKQLPAVFGRDVESFYAMYSKKKKDYILVTGTKKFINKRNFLVSNVLDEKSYKELKIATTKKVNLYFDEHLFVYFQGERGSKSILYVETEIETKDITIFEILMNCFNTYVLNLELNEEINCSQKEFIFMLSEAAEARSSETGNHVRRMTEYCKLLGSKLNLSPDDINLLYLIAPMHDIGKIGITDLILNYPGKLHFDDFETMKKHCQIGYDMLSKLDQPMMKAAAQIALEHHEKYDGTGYPRGLKGEEISLFARIVTLADVFDALGTNRIYKRAWALENILEYIKMESGKHFDPKIVDVFFDNLEEILKIRNEYREDSLTANVI